jgi:hypothetical protein
VESSDLVRLHYDSTEALMLFCSLLLLHLLGFPSSVNVACPSKLTSRSSFLNAKNFFSRYLTQAGGQKSIHEVISGG